MAFSAEYADLGLPPRAPIDSSARRERKRRRKVGRGCLFVIGRPQNGGCSFGWSEKIIKNRANTIASKKTQPYSETLCLLWERSLWLASSWNDQESKGSRTIQMFLQLQGSYICSHSHLRKSSGIHNAHRKPKVAVFSSTRSALDSCSFSLKLDTAMEPVIRLFLNV